MLTWQLGRASPAQPLGVSLARLETKLAIQALPGRLKEVELVDLDPPVCREMFVTFNLSGLPVVLRERAIPGPA
jgi:hypothetical protein